MNERHTAARSGVIVLITALGYLLLAHEVPAQDKGTDIVMHRLQQTLAGDGDAAVHSGKGDCDEPPATAPDPGAADAWIHWGGDRRNLRSRSAAQTHLTATNLPELKLQWAYAVPDVQLMRSQPAVAGDWLYLAGFDGTVRALDARTGCLIWQTDLEQPLFSGITLGQTGDGDSRLLVGDIAARVHALDPLTGKTVWQRRVAIHQHARISGTPAIYEDHIYVPVSSGEWAVVDPEYACCTFRGKVVALDLASGKTRWEYFTIDEAPRAQGKDKAGATIYAPSGAAVWSAVTVDASRNRLYAGTGNNYSQPATDTSSAIHAIDIATGQRAWVFQGTKYDAWTVSCVPGWREAQGWSKANCPEDYGPDFDFSAAPMLVSIDERRDILVVGQKSGVVYGLDPDRDGEVLWQTRVGRGGIVGGVHFGMAWHQEGIIVPVLDRDDTVDYEHEQKPGVVALDAVNGEIRWRTSALDGICEERDGCHPGFSAAATSLPGAALVGALDGYLQAFSTKTGERIWAYDTARTFETVNGIPGRGGAMSATGPIVTGDRIYVLSGYGQFAGNMPGNVLLAFAPE
jgi:polyvinyl alcohol dehydrogenase (cytochrome)